MIVSCACCGKSLRVADEHAGRRAKCPNCQTLVAIPKANGKVTEPAMQSAAPAAAKTPSTEQDFIPAATVSRPLPMTAGESPIAGPLAPIANPPHRAAPPRDDGHTDYGRPANAAPQQVVHHYHRPSSGPEPGIAALLEVLGGMFLQTFGIGHIYAGNVGLGLLFMFGYWFVCFMNFVLMFVLIGFLTYPMCWIMAMIISPIVAANSVKRY